MTTVLHGLSPSADCGAMILQGKSGPCGLIWAHMGSTRYLGSSGPYGLIEPIWAFMGASGPYGLIGFHSVFQ